MLVDHIAINRRHHKYCSNPACAKARPVAKAVAEGGDEQAAAMTAVKKTVAKKTTAARTKTVAKKTSTTKTTAKTTARRKKTTE